MIDAMVAEVVVRAGDVFRFRYHEGNGMFEPYHCFDGQLVAVSDERLVDTYWSYFDSVQCAFKFHSSSGREFRVADVGARGVLERVCNLADVRTINEGEIVYYDDSDIINLSSQHGCHRQFVIRRGATRSKEKMLQVLRERMDAAHRDLASMARNIASTAAKIQRIEDGHIDDTYI